MTTSKKAIVVGGGPAGLVAAGRLAEGGVATTLLEASARLGGRAASERREGFDLNQGPHALYAGGPAMRELRAMDINPPWTGTTRSWSRHRRRSGPSRSWPGSGWLRLRLLDREGAFHACFAVARD